MKKQAIILILSLLIFAGKVAGQCIGDLTADISGGTSPICYNTSPGTFTATGGGESGSYTYLWYQDGLSTGITTQTFDPGNLAATSTFYCAISSGTCGPLNTPTETITVYSDLTAGISGGISPICYNTSPGTFTATGGGGTGSYTYLWYQDGLSTGITTQTFDPGNLTASSTFYCAITSGTCGTVNTSTTTITVYSDLTAGISGGTSPICYNTSPGTFTATRSGGTGSYTYLWYKDGSSTGVTTQTYAPGNLTATSAFYCAITSGTCGPVNTPITTITVYSELTAGISGGTSPICYNTSPGTFTATGGGGTGSYTYLWYKNGSSTGVTTQTYAPGNLTATSTFYCRITSGTCGTVNTSTTTITVYANLTAGISGGTTPICYNTSPGTFTATGAGGTGSYTYLWYKDGSSTGITTQTFDPGNLTATSAFYCAVSSGACGTVNTSTKTITVYSELTVGISGGISPICYNTSPGTLTATRSGGTGSYTYLWYKDGSSTGVTSQNYAPGNLTATSAFYCAVTSGTCGTVNTSTTTITVNPLPFPIINGPTPVCITSTGNVYTTESGMTSYNWTVSSGGSKTAGGGATENSVTVTWNSSGARTVKVNYIDVNGCTATSQTTYNVTVDPKPLPTNVVINGELREYSTLTVSYDYDPGVCWPEDLSLTKISWYKANSSGGSGSSFITTKSGLDKTYILTPAEFGKYIQVRVELSDGTTLMSPVPSTGGLYIGPVAANEFPVASSVTITGTLKVMQTLTGSYIYSDAESDPEQASLYEWYRANDASGTGSVKIITATTQSYILTTNERNKFISFKVTPKAQSGSTPGVAVSSPWLGPVTDDPPVASNVTISGTAKVGQVITGHYQYTDTEGDSEGTSSYQWYTGTNSSGAGSTPISGANSISYFLTNNEIGKYIGFSVTPVAQAGATPGLLVTTTTWIGPVTNDAPVATILPVTGSLNVNGVLTGHYIYSDTEGDIESGSLYQWYSSATLGGIYTAILGETGISHAVALSEQGKFFKFYITPKAATGTITGTEVSSAGFGPANSKPYVDNVLITGAAEVGITLTVSYSFHDIDGDIEGTSSFRWLRNGVIPVSGATGTTYLVTGDDEGFKLSFEVTPVSSTGYPDTGTPVQSAQSSTVIDPSPLVPVASEVCIEGIRAAGQILRGKYFYTFYKSEGTSLYQWYRNGVSISGATGIQYTLLQVEDIDSNADITYSVTPKSSNTPPKTGIKVTSNPLARIILPKDEYSVAEADVTLAANVGGGVFSGPGVSAGIFSPSIAGSAGSPHTLGYLMNIVNVNHNCSQQASQVVVVNPNVAIFNGINSVYCHDSGEDIITVSGVPTGSSIIGFSLSDPAGIVSQSGFTCTIDPGKMRPGTNVDVLAFSYNLNSTFYRISQALVIDSVGTEMRILNLDPAFCKDDPKKYITIEGVYPAGGVGTWTGDILSDIKVASAYAEAALGNAGQVYPITYQYRSSLGCYGSLLSQDVVINAMPDPTFSLNPTYNIDGDPVVLVPVQAGGAFSGNGVAGNTLFPDIAGLGESEITYSITDANSCYKSLGIKTLIRKAQGTFTDIPSIICYSDTTYNVKITGLPAGVTITNFINTKNSIAYTPGATSADYNVPAAGRGSDTLIYSYKWDGVDYNISKSLIIDSLGQVLIKNLSAGQKICNNVAPFELFPSIIGGVFTGPLTGGFLDPLKATGNTAVSYKYTNQQTGCFTDTIVPITIYPAPVVAFAPVSVCIEDDTTRTYFINSTTSLDPVSSWLWVFSEATGDNKIFGREAANLYKTGGLHKVTLTATTINSCSVTKELTIDVGKKPTANFYWLNDCMHTNDSIILRDTSIFSSAIVSRSWSLFNGPEFSTDINTKYPQGETARYIKIQYVVRTSYTNCYDTVNKDIYIRPTIPILSDGYFENFEEGQAGWVKGDTAINSWSFGTPDRPVINKAASGVNAWFTGFDMLHPKPEASSIISPCFDFTAVERPMIKVRLWRRFEKERDGAALQYKVGDDKNWQYVGTLNDGINWFNSAVIRGRPGGDQLGWTTLGTPDAGWIEANHTLDILKGKSDVKFRIAYGNDGQYSDHDGIAFDDIWIGERMRNVLVEHFANLSSSDSKRATEMVHSIGSKKVEDVIIIQYHTNFPGSDPFYNDNPGDASARILFYGLTKAPYTFIDGGTRRDSTYKTNNFANIFDYVIADIDSNDVTRRSLIVPRFDISIDVSVFSGILTVSGTITALENINSDNLTLFLAVTEKENHSFTASNGETSFHNIFRKFIPDAGGIALKKSWTKGESFALSDQTWLINKITNSADIEVVAFLQNSLTKELYQATSVIEPNVIVGIENLFQGKGVDFALYPNPAVNKFTIAFEEPLDKDYDVRIYDVRGTVIASYKAESGISEYTVENLRLKGGIYLVRVSSGGVDMGFRKLIIWGD